jgi:alanyl-tRNA synthetase
VGSTVAVLEQVGAVGSADDLRLLASEVRDRLQAQPAVVAIGGIVDGKAAVIVATTVAARESGFSAGAFAKRAAGILGGGGGGRDDMAQGGGPAVDQLGAALADIRSHLEA